MHSLLSSGEHSGSPSPRIANRQSIAEAAEVFLASVAVCVLVASHTRNARVPKHEHALKGGGTLF